MNKLHKTKHGNNLFTGLTKLTSKKFTGDGVLSKHDKEPINRECTRIPKGIHLEIKKLEYPLSNNTEVDGTSINIAKHGICFTTPYQYDSGDMLSLSMKLNGWHRHRKGLTAILTDELSKTDVLTVIAEVVWSKESAYSSGYDIGVKFINVYKDDMIALDKYFAKILPDD